MNWLKNIIFLILGVPIGALLMTYEFDLVSSHMPEATQLKVGFAELASIGLTAATVALGSVALVVGIAAVFGFRSIQTESIRGAQREVARKLDDSLDARVDAAIIERLQPRIEAIIKSAGEGGAFDEAVAKTMYGSSYNELAEDFDSNDAGDR